MRYPTHEHFPISPDELHLPESQLDPFSERSYNLHHGLYSRNMMAKLALSDTCRNLEAYQWVMLKDQHVELHRRYEPTPVPPLRVMMERIDEAVANGEKLRIRGDTGYIRTDIPPELLAKINEEYNRLAEPKYV